jgi:hypothetical protein
LATDLGEQEKVGGEESEVVDQKVKARRRREKVVRQEKKVRRQMATVFRQLATVLCRRERVVGQRAKVLRQGTTALCQGTTDVFQETKVLSAFAEPFGRANACHFPKTYAEVLATNRNRPTTTNQTESTMATSIKSTHRSVVALSLPKKVPAFITYAENIVKRTTGTR